MSEQPLQLEDALRVIDDLQRAKQAVTADWLAHQKIIAAAGELVTGPRWQSGANNAMSRLEHAWYTLYPQESEKLA